MKKLLASAAFITGAIVAGVIVAGSAQAEPKYNFAVVPISWTNRRHGVSKLHIHEMGSRYAFIVLYVCLEAHLSRESLRSIGCC